ncbi:dehydrodolichyl diphosphate synthase CPT3-like [Silene latifolia]|uniref:dehydrodolichyl diphosphate synthase CPT3-like n=1 Tax=Silene latifolia TaxID=37657 RepID=UPI003D76DC33
MYNFLVKWMFRILSVGPLPNHIAFIMDGNRRFAKKKNLDERDGYRAGFLALMFMLKQCYELGIRYITIYSFAIDNFKRHPEEVKCLMELMQEKVEGFLEYEGMITKYGIRVIFVGNLGLLSESLRVAAKRAMEATSMNTTTFLLICVAYSSTDEIVRSVEKTFNFHHSKNHFVSEITENGEKKALFSGERSEEYDDSSEKEDENEVGIIKMREIKNNLYMSIAPEPDIVIRSSGATRLSNFLLWQTQSCLLYCPAVLWPELRLRHLVWAVLKFQRWYYYLDQKRQEL